jgi:transposase
MVPEGTISTVDGQRIYSGIDVSKKSWRVSIMIGSHYYRAFTQVPEPEALCRYLQKHFPRAEYHSVYEAGYCGYWIDRQLKALHINNIVVHPADVPTSDKEHRRKNDPVDSRKLARSLSQGELTPLYVPSEEAEHDRSLVRMRQAFVKKQTRCKLQIKSLLAFSGISVPADCNERYWSRRYIAWLQQLRFSSESGSLALQALLQELVSLRSQILELTRAIRDLSRTPRYQASVVLLRTIAGISQMSAMMFLTELVDIRRFHSSDHLASYVGLVPDEHSSGDEQHLGRVSRRRNSRLRAQLIESAWVAVHADPVLASDFEALSRRMPKTKAIIRIARKLLNRIRYVLLQRQPYRITPAGH